MSSPDKSIDIYERLAAGQEVQWLTGYIQGSMAMGEFHVNEEQ